MRKRGKCPSAEGSDTRRCGSWIAPADASEARSRYSGDAASRREWRAKDAGASPCGTGYPPNEVSRRRRSLEGCEAEGTLPATNSTRGAKRGFVLGQRRAEPSRVRRLRQDSPPTAYMYTPSGAKDAGIGRSRKASTVARNKAAHWKANQHWPANNSHHIPRKQTHRTAITHRGKNLV